MEGNAVKCQLTLLNKKCIFYKKRECAVFTGSHENISRKQNLFKNFKVQYFCGNIKSYQTVNVYVTSERNG
jgi:hypothetical protein